MPRLGQRLRTVADQIRSDTHVDIGSDHASLLVALLRSGRIRRGVAIENKPQPFQNSCAALAGMNADVRYGDGLSMLRDGEANSLSICGLGGGSIVQILDEFPERVPERIVIQPNRRSDLVRRWAYENGLALSDERHTRGRRAFEILAFYKSGLVPDPAYDDIDFAMALTFGPILLKRRDPDFERRLREESVYLNKLDRLSVHSKQRLLLVNRGLTCWA